MIVDEKIVNYINSLNSDEKEEISKIENQARLEHVPIIRTETKELLKVMIKMKQPMKILEVGTAVGFSSIFMNEYQSDDGTITTIERCEKRIQKAKINIANMNKQDKITLLEGDASEILTTLAPYYDMAFMDAAKGQYINFLPEIIRLLPVGGVLISDNVLQDGDVAKSRYAVTRRNRTIHGRMREYLYTLKHMKEFETVVLPIGDGVTISIKL